MISVLFSSLSYFTFEREVQYHNTKRHNLILVAGEASVMVKQSWTYPLSMAEFGYPKMPKVRSSLVDKNKHKADVLSAAHDTLHVSTAVCGFSRGAFSASPPSDRYFDSRAIPNRI